MKNTWVTSSSLDGLLGWLFIMVNCWMVSSAVHSFHSFFKIFCDIALHIISTHVAVVPCHCVYSAHPVLWVKFGVCVLPLKFLLLWQIWCMVIMPWNGSFCRSITFCFGYMNFVFKKKTAMTLYACCVEVC